MGAPTGKVVVFDSRGNFAEGALAERIVKVGEPPPDPGVPLAIGEDGITIEEWPIGADLVKVPEETPPAPGALLTLSEDGVTLAASNIDPVKIVKVGDTPPAPGVLVTVDEGGDLVEAEAGAQIGGKTLAVFGEAVQAGDILTLNDASEIIPAPYVPTPLSLVQQFNDPICYVREPEAAAGDTLAERAIGVVGPDPTTGHVVFTRFLVALSANVAGHAANYATITVRLRNATDGTVVGTAVFSTDSPITYNAWCVATTTAAFDIHDDILGRAYGFTVTLEVTKAGDGVQLPSFVVAVPWIPSTDVAAPTVVSTDPGDEAGDAALDVTPTVTFSEAMDPDYTPGACVLLDPDDNPVSMDPSTPEISENGLAVTLTPAAPLAPETTYRIRVRTGARDLSGNHLAAEYTQPTGFTTAADTDAPTVASVTPDDEATGVAVDVHPAVTFSEAMDPATLTTASVLLLDSLDAPVSCSIALSAGNTVATLTPAAPLTNDAIYRIRVTVVATDVAGNPLASQFTQATGFAIVSP